MKYIATVILFVSMTIAVHGQQPPMGAVPPPMRHSISLSSQHGESFSVFVDGELQNRLPQSRVLVNNVSDQTHEVVVILKRPVEKAAVLSIRPGEPNVVVNVNYDQRLEKLYLYTAAHNKPDAYTQPKMVVKPTPVPATDFKPVPTRPGRVPTPVSPDELNSMAARMQAQSFDSDRLALGKVLVAASSLTSEQIAYLARTLDYSQSQVDFLKYAYGYCLDPANYTVTLEVLTYRSDKQKVLDYIATQQR